MSKFRDNENDGDETAIDMSPLIDCVFILLIFFIVTTVFVEESGVEVDKPQPAAAAPDDSEDKNVVIDIRKDGQVLCEGQNIGLPGIYNIVRRRIDRDAESPIIIRAERGSRSETTIKVVGEVRSAGATKVSLTSVAPRG